MMKKGLFGVAAAAVLLALPASAQNVTGTVYVTGTVAGTCGAGTIDGGGSLGTQTLAFGTLNGTDGKIDSSLANGTTTKTANFTVICNTGTPTIKINSATAMSDDVPAADGFTSTVDYIATMTAHEAVGSSTSTETVDYDTYNDTSAQTLTLAHPLAGTSNNIQVTVHDLNTDGGANSSVLTAGDYGQAAGGSGGVITIEITP